MVDWLKNSTAINGNMFRFNLSLSVCIIIKTNTNIMQPQNIVLKFYFLSQKTWFALLILIRAFTELLVFFDYVMHFLVVCNCTTRDFNMSPLSMDFCCDIYFFVEIFEIHVINRKSILIFLK